MLQQSDSVWTFSEHSSLYSFQTLRFLTGCWIQFPVLYNRTSSFIHSIYKSLHLHVPNFQSSPPLFYLSNHKSIPTSESEETQAFDPGLRVPVSTLSSRSLFHCISIHHFFLHHSDCQNITRCQSRFQLSSLRQLLPTTTVDCLIKQSLYLAFKVLPRFSLTSLNSLLPTDLFLPFLPLCTSFVTHTHL